MLVGLAVWQAVLVHDPAGSDAFRSLPGVEDEGLLQPDGSVVLRFDHPVGARRLPVSRRGHAVGSIPVPILAISRNVEVPLLLSDRRELCKEENQSTTKRGGEGRGGKRDGGAAAAVAKPGSSHGS